MESEFFLAESNGTETIGQGKDNGETEAKGMTFDDEDDLW